MPTIAELVDSGAILKIEVELSPRDQPLRLLYGTPQFIEWLREILEGAQPSQLLGNTSPAEQIDDLFHSLRVRWRAHLGQRLHGSVKL